MMETDNLEQYDARLVADIKRAFAVAHELCPDVEAELSRFHQLHAPAGEEASLVVAPAIKEASDVDAPAEEPQQRPRRTLLLSLFGGAVAAAAAVVLFILLWYPREENAPVAQKSAYTQLFAATTQTALSVTTDGKPVSATASSPITVSGNDITVAASDEGGTSTIKTPAGQFYTVTLPDGTTVTLNAQSEFSFPAKFAADKREVYLKGEAYFDVHHDPNHPFVVKTDFFEATAVGTAFNVRAYSKEQANVTLIEGKLLVSNDKQSTVQIKPNEQTALAANGTLQTSGADTYQYTEWQNGTFYFDDIALSEILCELGRWYNVDIEVANQKILKSKLHFVADRNASIDEALHNLNALGLFRAIKKSRTIVLE